MPPCGETKSDLDIARLLTRRLNELAPGTSSFPWQKDAADFLDEVFTSTVYERLSIKHWRELEAGTRTYDMGIPWKDHRFATDDGKFHCCSLSYKRHTLSDIEVSILFFDTTRTAKH